MIARMLLALANFFVWLGDAWHWTTAEARLRITCVFGDFQEGFPPILARVHTPKWFKDMIEKAKAENAAGRKGSVKFTRCPGMHDYLQSGYLIRAHTDIHIKANSAGISVSTPHIADQPSLMPAPMDYEVVAGLAPIADGMTKNVTKVPLPYGIYMEPGHSCHLMPALMHSPELYDKLYVYPGTVDYDKFHVSNWIFTIIKPCEIIIPAGTPLLHVLPFKRVDYHGTIGKGSATDVAQLRYGFPSRVMGFYRRMFHTKKIYTNKEVKE